jgi:thymidylate kinase
MRIAVSGTHRAGKSTLIEELANHLPQHVVVEEPYHLMVEDGYEFAHPPSLEDFEAQLERSLAELEMRRSNVLFDRCPLDFLAYAAVHADAEGFDLDAWLPRVRAALETLDLIVLVSLEAERIPLEGSDEDDAELRSTVDEELREIVLDDCLGLDLRMEILEVEGSVAERANATLRRIQMRR